MEILTHIQTKAMELFTYVKNMEIWSNIPPTAIYIFVGILATMVLFNVAKKLIKVICSAILFAAIFLTLHELGWINFIIGFFESL